MTPPLKISSQETQAKELATWQAIAGALAQSLHLPDILDAAVEKILEVLELEAAGIYLRDESSGVLQLAAQAGRGWESLAGSKAGPSIAEHAAQVAASGQPRLIQLEELEARQHPIYLALAPVGYEGQRCGVLVGLLRRGSEHGEADPGEADLGLLARFGDQIGLAVANVRLHADAQEKLAQLAALQETSRAVVSTLELNALLKLIVQQATRLMRAEGGILNLADLPAGEDEVVATAGSTAEFLGVRYSLQKSLSGWATLHKQPVISNQLQDDPRVAHIYMDMIKTSLKNAVAVPLNHKGKVLGSLVIVDKFGGKRDFTQDDLDLLVAFANQAAVAVENIRYYERAQHLAVMEERNRLARELHDAVTQTIFSASLLAEALPEVLNSDPQQGLQLVQELRSLSRGALAEMRTLLLELRPAALVEARLEDLLRQLGEAASGREGIPVSVTIEGQGSPPSEVHIALYRIAQEALNNVVKHAQARQVSIRLCYTCTESESPDQPAGTSVLLIIRDDGCGFDLGQVASDHLGLGIMEERAQDIGASLSIESRPGEGTQVTVLWEAHPHP